MRRVQVFVLIMGEAGAEWSKTLTLRIRSRRRCFGFSSGSASGVTRNIERMVVQPGIHKAIPAGEYHRLKLASASILSEFRRSPAHAREAMDHPKEPTPEMLCGTAAHTAILEPTAFRARYIMADQCAATTGKGKQCSKGGSAFRDGIWYCGQHDPMPGKPMAADYVILSRDDYDRALLMAESVRKHPAAAELLAMATDIELTGIWRDPASGAECKMRADLLCQGGIVADLKTTTDASPEAFSKTVYEYRYFIQGAHYLRGLTALGVPVREFRFIAAEKKPPFALAVYRMSEDDLCRGIDELERLLLRWQACVESGVWPGYGDGVMDLALPEWAAKKMDRAFAEAAF